MKETIDLLGKIITNILTALYEPFGFSLLLSFLAMFFYLYAYEPSAAGKGWKNAIVTWYQKFKESVFFRRLFFLAFVTSLILFRTLLNRNLWMNPLSDVMGGWGIWETVNGEQKLTTECIENVIMMVPFSAVVMWTFEEKIGNSWKKILWYSGKSIYLFDKHRCIFLCDEIALPEIWKSDVRKWKSSMRVYSRSVLSRPYTSRMDLSCSASILVMLI